MPNIKIEARTGIKNFENFFKLSEKNIGNKKNVNKENF
jgi:hypothetical protein